MLDAWMQRFGCRALAVAASLGYSEVVEMLLSTKAVVVDATVSLYWVINWLVHTTCWLISHLCNFPTKSWARPIALPILLHHSITVKWCSRVHQRRSFYQKDLEAWITHQRKAHCNHFAQIKNSTENGTCDSVKSVYGKTGCPHNDCLQDHQGRTALWHAASSGQYDCVVKLVTLGNAKVNLFTLKRSTPLMAAAAAGYLPVVQFLLEHKADLDFADASQQTALMMSASRGNAEALELLLRCHARSNMQDQVRADQLQVKAIHIDMRACFIFTITNLATRAFYYRIYVGYPCNIDGLCSKICNMMWCDVACASMKLWWVVWNCEILLYSRRMVSQPSCWLVSIAAVTLYACYSHTAVSLMFVTSKGRQLCSKLVNR